MAQENPTKDLLHRDTHTVQQLADFFRKQADSMTRTELQELVGLAAAIGMEKTAEALFDEHLKQPVHEAN